MPCSCLPTLFASSLRSLKVVDLHADPMLSTRDFNELSHVGHVDVPRMIQGNMAVQVRAIERRKKVSIPLYMPCYVMLFYLQVCTSVTSFPKNWKDTFNPSDIFLGMPAIFSLACSLKQPTPPLHTRSDSYPAVVQVSPTRRTSTRLHWFHSSLAGRGIAFRRCIAAPCTRPISFQTLRKPPTGGWR